MTPSVIAPSLRDTPLRDNRPHAYTSAAPPTTTCFTTPPLWRPRNRQPLRATPAAGGPRHLVSSPLRGHPPSQRPQMPRIPWHHEDTPAGAPRPPPQHELRRRAHDLVAADPDTHSRSSAGEDFHGRLPAPSRLRPLHDAGTAFFTPAPGPRCLSTCLARGISAVGRDAAGGRAAPWTRLRCRTGCRLTRRRRRTGCPRTRLRCRTGCCHHRGISCCRSPPPDAPTRRVCMRTDSLEMTNWAAPGRKEATGPLLLLANLLLISDSCRWIVHIHPDNNKCSTSVDSWLRPMWFF